MCNQAPVYLFTLASALSLAPSPVARPGRGAHLTNVLSVLIYFHSTAAAAGEREREKEIGSRGPYARIIGKRLDIIQSLAHSSFGV